MFQYGLRSTLLALMVFLFSASGFSKDQITSIENIRSKTLSTFSLQSKYIEDKATIEVFLPEDYNLTGAHIRYPVIYTLDGWVLSQSVSGIIHHMSHTAAIPKAIVVAIHIENETNYGPALYQSQSGWGDDPAVRLSGFSGGKIDPFMNFLENELISHIDQTYRTNSFRAIIGMSPTATIVLHSFWKSPDLFDAHIAFAATDVLGMGYTADTTFIDKIRDSLSKSPNRKGYLYVSSAKYEAVRSPKRLENVKALQDQLAPYLAKNFRLKVEHIENSGHYPSAVPSLLNALELIFPAKHFRLSGQFNNIIRTEDQPLQKILDIYKNLSAEVGFTVYPNLDLRRNATCIRTAAARSFGMKKYDQSEALYRYWVNQSPLSHKAFAGLAYTLDAKGKTEEAIEAIEKAIELAEPNNIQEYQALLKKIRSKRNTD